VSKETEALAARTRPPFKQVIETFACPSSYATGGNWFNSTVMKRIENAICLQITGGYHGSVVTGSVRSGMATGGNAFRLQIFTGSAEVNSGGNVSAQSVTVLLEGL